MLMFDLEPQSRQYVDEVNTLHYKDRFFFPHHSGERGIDNARAVCCQCQCVLSPLLCLSTRTHE
jgi:hypothetical protein